MKTVASLATVSFALLALACGGEDATMDEMGGMEGESPGMMADSAGMTDEGMPEEMMPDSAGGAMQHDTTGMSGGG